MDIYCPGDVMVAMRVLETRVERRGSSTLPWGTKQSGVSIMDNTEGFYPFNVGSIPARRTIFLGVYYAISISYK